MVKGIPIVPKYAKSKILSEETLKEIVNSFEGKDFPPDKDFVISKAYR